VTNCYLHINWEAYKVVIRRVNHHMASSL